MGVTSIEGSLGRINLRMASTLELGEVLAEVTRGLVEDLNAALARIWLFGPGDLCAACIQAPHCPNRTSCLHLVASAGLSERLDGGHRRVPIGALKIGRIAESREPVCTNDLPGDPRIADKEWVCREGLPQAALSRCVQPNAESSCLGMAIGALDRHLSWPRQSGICLPQPPRSSFGQGQPPFDFQAVDRDFDESRCENLVSPWSVTRQEATVQGRDRSSRSKNLAWLRWTHDLRAPPISSKVQKRKGPTS